MDTRLEVPGLPEGKQYHLYVCCDEENSHIRKYAYEFVKDMRAEYGLKCFFPLDDVRGGNFLPSIISDKIEASLKIVVLLTREYIQNDFNNYELQRVLSYECMNQKDGNCLIPVLMEDLTLPPVLQDRKCINAFLGDPVKETIYDTIVGTAFAGEVHANRLERVTRDFEELQSVRDEPSISSELRSLLGRSKLYFENNVDSSTFVRTAAYEKSLDTLTKNNVLVLTGHPGEGKTTIATQLLLATTSPERILKINSPSDWKHVDPSSDLFDAIMIDDIFGEGILEDLLLLEWDRELRDVERITQPRKKPKENTSSTAKKNRKTQQNPGTEKPTKTSSSKSTSNVKDIKPIKVIITTRHYILEESKPKIERLRLFRKENIQILLSSELTEREMSHMLDVHLKENKRTVSHLDISLCLHSRLGQNVLSTRDSQIPFGFPECVSLYSNNDDIFNTGPEFFANPVTFFKKCVEDLVLDEDRFFGLLIIWANTDQRVTLAELELSSISQRVKEIAISFGISLDAVKKARKSLKPHEGSFLTYTVYDGSYEFSHRVISDMIGIVLSKDYPEATLKYAQRDFLMKYVSVRDGEADALKFIVEPRLYGGFTDAIIRVIAGHPAQRVFTSRLGANLGESLRWFRQESGYKPNMNCDFSMIFHEAFNNPEFVDRFLTHIHNEKKVGELFSNNVLQFDGVFKGYGIKFEKLPFRLLSYLVLSNKYMLAKEIIQQKVLACDETIELETSEMDISLLLAVDKEDDEMVKFLLQHGASVSGDSLYIAAHKANLRLLDILVTNPRTDVNDTGHIIGGNTALIMSAKRGNGDVVRYLLEKGADVQVRNKKNMSALDKAVLHKQEATCKILVKHGANVNVKGGKFKRTPLHVAADMGLVSIVDMLLAKGAQLDIKDHKGHCPIHCAAIRGHIDIVAKIIIHDKTKANLKATSYGTKSFLKGLTPYHIAIWKGNHDLLQSLIKLGVAPNVGNCYGETPLYYAISREKAKHAKQLIAVADINKQQKQGFTPLHMSIYRGMDEVTGLLINRADVNLRDKFGKTPLHVACEKGNIAAIKLLVNARADIRMITKRGDTVYHILTRSMHKSKGNSNSKQSVRQIVQLLREKDPDFAAKEVTNKKGHTCSAPSFPEYGMHPALQKLCDEIVRTKLRSLSSPLEASASCDSPAVDDMLLYPFDLYDDDDDDDDGDDDDDIW